MIVFLYETPFKAASPKTIPSKKWTLEKNQPFSFHEIFVTYLCRLDKNKFIFIYLPYVSSHAPRQKGSMKITDENIIDHLQKGEEDAFRYIYDKYYGYLCAVAKGYLCDDIMAETVVEDVIYNIWEIREKLNIHTSLRSYLIRSVKNRAINYLQQEYIAKEVSVNSLQDYTEIESFYFIEEEHPLEKILETELENTIATAVDNLPEECRKAFIMSRNHDMKYEEIAAQMGISVNTVKYHIKNALSRLRVDLKDYLMVLLILSVTHQVPISDTLEKLLEFLNI